MKERGFLLFGTTVCLFSRAVLPAQFLYRGPYQTVTGQPIWGDMLYLRDAASPGYESVWGTKLSLSKLLKLVALFDLFRLPDCAAEVIQEERERLEEIVDTAKLLDLLTPMLDGRRVSYEEYVAAFRQDVTRFYPPPPSAVADPEVSPVRVRMHRAQGDWRRRFRNLGDAS
jgi:hypothetical protein